MISGAVLIIGRPFLWAFSPFSGRAETVAQRPHSAAIQLQLNVLDDNPAVLSVCEKYKLATINRGLLTREQMEEIDKILERD